MNITLKPLEYHLWNIHPIELYNPFIYNHTQTMITQTHSYYNEQMAREN